MIVNFNSDGSSSSSDKIDEWKILDKNNETNSKETQNYSDLGMTSKFNCLIDIFLLNCFKNEKEEEEFHLENPENETNNVDSKSDTCQVSLGDDQEPNVFSYKREYNRVNWTDEKCAYLIKLTDEHGLHWSKITKAFNDFFKENLKIHNLFFKHKTILNTNKIDYYRKMSDFQDQNQNKVIFKFRTFFKDYFNFNL